jgi:peptidoglycan lytic transglycosylase G
MARRALLAVAVLLVVAGCGNASSAPPTTTRAAPRPPKPFRIVFPEGFTRVQMAVRVKDVAKIAQHERRKRVRLNEDAYLAASKNEVVRCFGRTKRADLEGFLFPATYDFLRGTTSRQLVRAQLDAFCRNWRSVSLAYARSKNLTPYDVLIIASMIEKEAAVPSERPLIAAVIYNRLHEGMPLGIDATLRYGLGIPPTESIHESQLHNPTPYNTRLHYGLPPTPISNPGIASIRAAAHPAKVDYLYYARKRDHRHHFFTASGSAYNQFLAQNGYG